MTYEEQKQIFSKMFSAELEKAGVSAEGISQATRINLPFINALLEGQLDQLPGEVFGKGFLKSICKVLSIDGSQLLEAYNACWLEQDSQKPIKNSTPSKNILKSQKPAKLGKKSSTRNIPIVLSKQSIIWIGGPIVALFLGTMLFFVVRPVWQKANEIAEKKEPVNQEIIAETIPSESLTEVPESEEEIVTDHSIIESKEANAQPPIESSGMNITEKTAAIEVSNDENAQQSLTIKVKSHLKVGTRFDNGQRNIVEMSPDTYRYTFKEVAELLIHDAAAVEVFYNGRNLGSLGETGRIRRLSFQAKNVKSETKSL